jgi:hypothetical protein
VAGRNGPGALAGAAEVGIGLTIACPDTTNWRGAASAIITASEWRPLERNTLKGFLTLALPSGLTLRECSLHEKHGRRWVGLPSRPQIDAMGRHRSDPAGKRLYLPIVEIPDRGQRERFQRAALAAVDRLLEKGGAP